MCYVFSFLKIMFVSFFFPDCFLKTKRKKGHGVEWKDLGRFWEGKLTRIYCKKLFQ